MEVLFLPRMGKGRFLGDLKAVRTISQLPVSIDFNMCKPLLRGNIISATHLPLTLLNVKGQMQALKLYNLVMTRTL